MCLGFVAALRRGDYLSLSFWVGVQGKSGDFVLTSFDIWCRNGREVWVEF